ncbi:MAG TPA: signal peptidase II [Dissulfurispiraceae bacterium]|nr:signal peptidase II [Dissulfurispiraceae bacterium]
MMLDYVLCRITVRSAFVIAFIIYMLDQTTKYLAKQTISPFETIAVTSFFNLVYVENLGSAFGLFKSMGVYFFIAVAVIAAVLVTLLILKDPQNRIAFSLVLGGALGNLTDRVVHGAVIDFLDFHVAGHHWPAFNVADIGLTSGIVMMLVSAFFGEDSGRKKT